VVDFSMFCGSGPTARNNNARLLLVGTRYGTNAALLVSRMLGLKNPADFSPEKADSGAAQWEVARFSDTQGKIWRKLSVRALLENHEFMNIGA
jgi:twitching motility protein PilI